MKTVKQATIQSLEDLGARLVTHNDVYRHMAEKNYYDFTQNRTPSNYVSAVLGNFIRQKDRRVKRVYDRPGNRYFYYLAKYEDQLDLGELDSIESQNVESKKASNQTGLKFHERDLHILLSTYLNNENVYTKTIFHERSNSSDSNKKWVHPDMVGVKFQTLQSKSSQNLLKVTNKNDLFKLYSYELKKEINSDYELKKYYFQAVSNSSWANYGYLVAFNITSSVYEELERLNDSFGIGVIELKPDLFQSEVLLPAKYRSIDFRTVDKLCKINPDFDGFIENVEKMLSVEARYARSVEREIADDCDGVLNDDAAIEAYLAKKGIEVRDETNTN